jgi:hypothetical protein
MLGSREQVLLRSAAHAEADRALALEVHAGYENSAAEKARAAARKEFEEEAANQRVQLRELRMQLAGLEDVPVEPSVALVPVAAKAPVPVASVPVALPVAPMPVASVPLAPCP